MKKITNELLQNFTEYLQNEEKSEATIEKYKRDINSFMVWCNGKELSKKTVLIYKEKLINEYAPKSVNSIISSLNSFFVYNEWFELKVKSLRIQKQIYIEKEKELTKAEYERLLRVAQKRKNKRLYYLMQTICSSGIRVSELKFITVEAIRKGEATIKCKGKMRVVFLSKELCRMLREYVKKEGIKNGAVFVTRNGKELDRSTICAHVIISPEFENPVIARV